MTPAPSDTRPGTHSSGRPRWDRVLVAGMFAVMVLIAFVNILGRYLFHYSLAFTEEVTIYLFVWMTIVGSGIAFERGGHLGMVSLHRRLPPRIRRGVTVGGAALSAVLFLTVDILLVQTIYQEMTLFRATSQSLGVPVWIYYAGVVLLSPTVFAGIVRGQRRDREAEARRVVGGSGES